MYGQTYVIKYGNRKMLIDEMGDAGIQCCIEPAIDVDSNELLLNFSYEYLGFVYVAVGNHLTRCIRYSLHDFKRIRVYAKKDGIIAIGGTGLDYHHERKKQHRLRQKVWFHWQITLADKIEFPLIFHIRKADVDAIKIFRKNKSKLHGRRMPLLRRSC